MGTCAGKNILSAKSLHGFLQMFPLNPAKKHVLTLYTLLTSWGMGTVIEGRVLCFFLACQSQSPVIILSLCWVVVGKCSFLLIHGLDDEHLMHKFGTLW
jgi:hypothetical protein